MMISKTKISAEGFEKVEITAEMAGIFGLPKKAIGKWAVVAEDEVERRLMKVRLDGYFADDKYNNHQRISNRIWGQMFGGCAVQNLNFPSYARARKTGYWRLLTNLKKLLNSLKSCGSLAWTTSFCKL